MKSIPICGAGGVPHVDCVPHRELNDTVIWFCLAMPIFTILTKLTFVLLKVSLYKKLIGLLPAPEGCSKDEDGSLSTTEVFFVSKTIMPSILHQC